MGNGYLSAPPSGIYTGLRAVTTQSYTEANSKNGTQHEGSTLFNLAGLATNDTFFVTGALPVSLKGRVIGFTGDGVTAEIFTGAVEEYRAVITGLTNFTSLYLTDTAGGS